MIRILFILLLSAPLVVNGQDTTTVTNPQTGKSETFSYVERMPEAPYNVVEYLSKEIKYPAKARKEKIEGRVNIKFVVNTTGDIELMPPHGVY